MKSNWCTLELCLAESANRYFKVLTDAVGDLVSPVIYLLFKYPLTTIINFSLSRLPSAYIFAL